MARERLHRFRWHEGLIPVCLLLIGATGLEARPKTDAVFLKNGDRVTCEIMSLQRGLLKVKTDAMGTIDIEWEKIDRVSSEFFFEVRLESGRKLYGAIEHLKDEDKMVVSGMPGPVAVSHTEVVDIAPIDATFWERLKGAVDLGYSFTQSQSSTQWTGSAELSYRTENYLGTADAESEFKKQGDADPVSRNQLDLGLRRFLARGWVVFGLNQLQQNESLELDFRWVLAGGGGRALIQTNRWMFGLLGGLALTQEQYTGEKYTTSGEAVGAVQFEFFRYDTPKADVSTQLLAFPGLTQWGRIRLEWNGRVRFEILKDVYWSVNANNSFNSEPPTRTARTNDFSLWTSLGWSF